MDTLTVLALTVITGSLVILVLTMRLDQRKRIPLLFKGVNSKTSPKGKSQKKPVDFFRIL